MWRWWCWLFPLISALCIWVSPPLSSSNRHIHTHIQAQRIHTPIVLPQTRLRPAVAFQTQWPHQCWCGGQNPWASPGCPVWHSPGTESQTGPPHCRLLDATWQEAEKKKFNFRKKKDLGFLEYKEEKVMCIKCVCMGVCVCSYPLAISQVDLPEGGVKLWGWLTLMVLIEEDRRTANLHTQLLCPLRDT